MTDHSLPDHAGDLSGGLRLLTFNVLRNGNGEAGDRRPSIASIIGQYDPAVLCLQEGGDGPFWSKLARRQGYGHSQNIAGEFQPALHSRLPVTTIATHNRVKFVYFQLQLDAGPLGIYSVHLPHPPQREDDRADRLHKLLAVVRAQRDPLVCIAGDFNSRTRGEPGLEWVVQAIADHNQCTINDHDWVRATDLMAEQGFIDCYRRMNDAPGYSLHPCTKHQPPETGSRRPTGAMPPAVRIDYIYANAALAERLVECRLDISETALAASDHLPLTARFEC